jgi:hypothetical protein
MERSRYCGQTQLNAMEFEEDFTIDFFTNWFANGQGFNLHMTCQSDLLKTCRKFKLQYYLNPRIQVFVPDCGIAREKVSRIVGGRETEVNEYPWHVGLVQTVLNI